MMLTLLTETVATHMHPIWNNVFFYLFTGLIILFGGIFMVVMKTMKKKSSDLKHVQLQHVARIDVVRKEHSDNLENLRIEMLKREEERTRQWMESEKETLYVLNGISNLLDLTDKIARVDSEKILNKLDEIKSKIKKLKETP